MLGAIGAFTASPLSLTRTRKNPVAAQPKGTQQFLFAKCLSELLRLTLEGENQMLNPFTYFCLVMWIVTATYWVYRMNDALKKFRGEFIIPVLQVHFTVIAIISGGIYFEELIGLPGLCCPGYTGFFSGVRSSETGSSKPVLPAGADRPVRRSWWSSGAFTCWPRQTRRSTTLTYKRRSRSIPSRSRGHASRCRTTAFSTAANEPCRSVGPEGTEMIKTKLSFQQSSATAPECATSD
eukprot:scaffold1282_cov251-Pinguiococcus_pyrenoidosus.AAC.62